MTFTVPHRCPSPRAAPRPRPLGPSSSDAPAAPNPRTSPPPASVAVPAADGAGSAFDPGGRGIAHFFVPGGARARHWLSVAPSASPDHRLFIAPAARDRRPPARPRWDVRCAPRREVTYITDAASCRRCRPHWKCSASPPGSDLSRGWRRRLTAGRLWPSTRRPTSYPSSARAPARRRVPEHAASRRRVERGADDYSSRPRGGW